MNLRYRKSSINSDKMNRSRGLRVQTVIWFLAIENCIDTNQICIWLNKSTVHGICNRFAIRILNNDIQFRIIPLECR